MKATARQFADPFVARNNLVHSAIVYLFSGMVTTATETHSVTNVSTFGSSLLNLEMQLDCFNDRFEHLQGEGVLLPLMVSAVQDLRFLHLSAIELCLTPIVYGGKVPAVIGQAALALKAIRDRLNPAYNFPQPEEVEKYPPGVVRMWEAFIWSDAEGWDRSKARIEEVIRLVGAAIEQSEDGRNYPFLKEGVALLSLLLATIRPATEDDGEPDLIELVEAELTPAKAQPARVPADAVEAEERALLGLPS